MEMLLRSMQAALIALALATAVPAGGTANALAGTYHVYGCRTPTGQPAPADGWSGSVAPGGAFDQYARNTCAEGGALIAALGDQTVHGAYIDKATWTFTAPAGETIAGAALFRSGDNPGGGNAAFSYEFWLAGASEASFFDLCVVTLGCPAQGNAAQPLSAENRLAASTATLGTRLYASAACAGGQGAECPAGTGDASGYASALYVYASDITLEQDTGPTAGDVAGELASAPVVRGTSDMTFTASDAASGVYEAAVTVDGQVVASPLLDDNGGRCRNVGQAADGRPAFLYVQPCAPAVSAEVSLDTTRLADGAHHLAVSVLDAAGNPAPVLDREITVANPPSGCAAGAPVATGASAQATLSASWKGAKGTRLTTRFGRSRTILGRLTGPAGAPIAGATVELLATPSYQGAAPALMPGALTARDGRFSVRLPRSVSSRTICLAYRPPGGAPPVTRTLTLNVRAGVALSVFPQETSVGRQISFHGKLLAGPIPPDGKQLVLEARSPGGPWIEFQVIRTGSRGRYHAAYRFRFPGPADYDFRALSEAESDYPFAAGSSNVVHVHER